MTIAINWQSNGNGHYLHRWRRVVGNIPVVIVATPKFSEVSKWLPSCQREKLLKL